MDNLTKKPDQKLSLGAKIGLITNIITIVISFIFLILIIVGSSIFKIAANEADPTGSVKTMNMNAAFITLVVIALLIVVAISIVIIIMCNNVLKSKVSSGLTVGILTLVLAGLGLLTSFTGGGLTIGTFFVLSGLNIASGVLLIVGKYVPANNNVEVVESELSK